jgi:hypothetical protein
MKCNAKKTQDDLGDSIVVTGLNSRQPDMAADQKQPDNAPKKKIVRCSQTCTYVTGGKEPRRCKNKCAQEAGHLLSCKCRSHELQ